MGPLSVQENTVPWFIVVIETKSHKAGVSKFVFNNPSVNHTTGNQLLMTTYHAQQEVSFLLF